MAIRPARLIGASLSEPHTSEKLVRSSRIQTSTRKSERIPYLVGTVVSRIQTTPTKSEQIHIWLVRLFMSQKITNTVY